MQKPLLALALFTLTACATAKSNGQMREPAGSHEKYVCEPRNDAKEVRGWRIYVTYNFPLREGNSKAVLHETLKKEGPCEMTAEEPAADARTITFSVLRDFKKCFFSNAEFKMAYYDKTGTLKLGLPFKANGRLQESLQFECRLTTDSNYL